MYAQKLSKAVSRPWLADAQAYAPLLPFLYQTSTIRRSYATNDVNLKPSEEEVNEELQAIKERWSSAGKRPRPSQQRSAARPRSRQPKVERIPFQGSTGSTNPEEQFEDTTMTPRELRIFEELFRKGVMTKPAETKHQFVKRTQHAFPDLLQPLADEADLLRQQAALEASREQMPAKSEDNEIKDKQSKMIEKLMDEARTDIELFRTLRTNVFARLKGIGEDGPVDSAKYAALPALLRHYVSLMQEYFPSSPLGLVVLPELRKLGPSAFALGASTELYNQHMRMLWQKYTDVDGIVDILAEMDKEVYSFNDDTLELLDQMFEHAALARNGELGPGRRALWSTDRKERALQKLRKWRNTVSERSQAAALREAQKQHAVFEDDDEEIQQHTVAA